MRIGLVGVLGSGETSAHGGMLYETLVRHFTAPVSIGILETPAGFELNSPLVAGRVADYMKNRLQNYSPMVTLIPARKKGTPNSPDAPEAVAHLYDSQLIYFGAGSPTYAVRQLEHSLAWDVIRARHWLGASLGLASAATIALGTHALPVYEIYKVGEDPYWKPGLDFFGIYGLKLVFIPHWNNGEGGGDLDTTRCYIGRSRFDPLVQTLPPDTTIIGLDEHTGLVFDIEQCQASVLGKDSVHLLRAGQERSYSRGMTFSLSELGDFRLPSRDELHIPQSVWQAAEVQPSVGEDIPEEAKKLLAEREEARVRQDWKKSDELRLALAALGWRVKDTRQGAELERMN